MNAYLSSVNAGLVCLAIYLLAGGLAAPLRRWLHKQRAGHRPVAAGLRHLLGAVLRPIFVLVWTQLVLLLLRQQASAAAWLSQHAHEVSAWQLFWVGVLILLLLENLTRQLYNLRGQAFPVPDLLGSILRALIVLALAFAVLRAELGINLAPLLASTALLTAVIGFALQGVLGNLLAGMSLHVVKTVIPGDWVTIGDIEGKVMQTNWRETRLRSRDGHVLIVPNSKVAESTIHNMVRPTPLRRHQFHVGASYADAPDEVIAALLEAAASVPEVQAHPAPDAFIIEYQDFGINYRLRFWTKEYYRRNDINGDVGRMVWYQFKRRGIEIPFPMSDQLLNDFMAVVYNQRQLQPEKKELDSRVTDLLRSDFCTRFCVDEKGQPLVNAEDLRQIVPCLRRLRYTRGETLFRQGDAGSTFYVVVKGRLKGHIDHEQGLPVTEFELGPGAILGEMSLLTGLPRTATITVLESAELLEFDEGAFSQILSLHDGIPEILSRVVAERAAANAASLERIKKVQAATSAEDLKQPNILKRFLRMIRGGSGS